ncbi:General transcription factor II-I repeat domain-containing protein 2 [Eumeta japonica]|uniref:General transcription factor II-I repeat domain-containing protein 2 n=1 Tax=Eumeta variegata TaxID=151549 RepID=A0A4C1VSF2_EUMVA|nr:General transcription factor II-I repeat domain-containing protein 2 [Eumeta japonica]
MELIEIQENSLLKSKFEDVELCDFYKKYHEEDHFPQLRKFARRFLCSFGSTYRCEQFFSIMKINKSKHCTRLTRKRVRCSIFLDNSRESKQANDRQWKTRYMRGNSGSTLRAGESHSRGAVKADPNSISVIDLDPAQPMTSILLLSTSDSNRREGFYETLQRRQQVFVFTGNPSYWTKRWSQTCTSKLSVKLYNTHSYTCARTQLATNTVTNMHTHTHFLFATVLHFPIPNDASRKNKWIRNISLLRNEPRWLPTPHSIICSRHFKTGDITDPVSGRKYKKLKKDAVPYVPGTVAESNLEIMEISSNLGIDEDMESTLESSEDNKRRSRIAVRERALRRDRFQPAARPRRAASPACPGASITSP